MSENIPESIPTSMDPRSKRPAKKRALSPASIQSAQLTQLMKNPDRNVNVNRPRDRRMAPPPEIVANVQGSSAGAGSGEFHVYKASRRREYERLKTMDEELKKEKDAEEFDKKTVELRKQDAERTAKNRAKRNRKKQGAAMKAKAVRQEERNGAGKKKDKEYGDEDSGNDDSGDENAGEPSTKKKGSFSLPKRQQASTRKDNRQDDAQAAHAAAVIPDNVGRVIIDDD